MIVGIFGDSFAEPLNTLSWTHLLQNQYEVRNYAKSCTTTFWSYRNLISEINNIDVIMFALTDENRLYHSDIEFREVCTLSTLQHHLDDPNLSMADRAIYESAKQYHIHLSDLDFNEFVQAQLVKEIKLLAEQHNKRLIIIPAFQKTVQYQDIFEISLFEITRNELYTNFGDFNFRPEQFATRSNHLSKENNELLAFKISEIIKNKIEKVTLGDFVFTKYDNPEIYWRI